MKILKKMLGGIKPDLWIVSTLLVAGLVTLPVLKIASSVLVSKQEIWAHLKTHLLADLLTNSFYLSSGVLAVTFLIGVSVAGLVSFCEFSGRRFFSRALLLPLSMPAYVMAFVYTGLLDFSGPVQTFLRSSGMLAAGSFPEIRSTWGVISVLSLSLFPYVFLLASSGFSSQGESVMEAGRSLGQGRWRVFFRVSLPMARPWIFGGLLLVLMETLADFGAVSIFNYDTFTTAIYKAWFGFFSLEAASQLASILVVLVLFVIAGETHARKKMRFHQGRYHRSIKRVRLSGLRAATAWSYLAFIFFVSFLLPVGQLLVWTLNSFGVEWSSGYFNLVYRSLGLGLMGALVTICCAVVISWTERTHDRPFIRLLTRVSLVGYALPGTVLAVGAVQVVAGVDNIFSEGLRIMGFSLSGPLLQGSVLLMPVAYMVRFLTAGYSAVSGSIGRITPSMDEASRTMGVTGFNLLRRVHLPIIRNGLFTGMLLVFIDIMKEMPLTLMTRPFGWDTLAVKIYELTSEGEWERAALPAVTLVLAGMIPVFLLSRQKDKQF